MASSVYASGGDSVVASCRRLKARPRVVENQEAESRFREKVVEEASLWSHLKAHLTAHLHATQCQMHAGLHSGDLLLDALCRV